MHHCVEALGARLRDPAGLAAAASRFNISPEALFGRLVELEFFERSQKRDYFTGGSAEHPPEPPGARVADIEEQIPHAFLQDALLLHQSADVSAGKLAEWFFATRLTVEDYLASLSRRQEREFLEEPRSEAQLVEPR